MRLKKRNRIPFRCWKSSDVPPNPTWDDPGDWTKRIRFLDQSKGKIETGVEWTATPRVVIPTAVVDLTQRPMEIDQMSEGAESTINPPSTTHSVKSWKVEDIEHPELGSQLSPRTTTRMENHRDGRITMGSADASLWQNDSKKPTVTIAHPFRDATQRRSAWDDSESINSESSVTTMIKRPRLDV